MSNFFILCREDVVIWCGVKYLVFIGSYVGGIERFLRFNFVFCIKANIKFYWEMKIFDFFVFK